MAQKVKRRTKKQVHNLWIKALESGEYPQGKEALRVGDSFCCLGVVCDLAYRDGGDPWKLEEGGYSYKGEEGYLPGPMATFLGVSRAYQNSLVELNDMEGWNFKDIAKVLRLFFKGVDMDTATEKIASTRRTK